jgi:cycloeucalenol cycloisomerase
MATNPLSVEASARAVRSRPGRARWLSPNPDKAFAERLYLLFVPVFLAYNAAIQRLGWLDAGNLGHVVQNLAMWLPYCVLLPAWLRRRSPIPWHRSAWFKLNLYMAVWVFYATYFHTEYFFEVLGLRYRFPDVTLTFDSALVGPDEGVAAASFEKVPVGMYFNAIAFFLVYHTAAVVCMRRVRSATLGLAPLARRLSWAAIVGATALFFAWAETRLYVTDAAEANVWYVDLPRMLRLGSIFYALYFVVSFPNVYRLDEAPDQPPWSLGRTVVEASFVAMTSLLLLDLWARWLGPIA